MKLSRYLCISDDWQIDSSSGTNVFLINTYDNCQPYSSAYEERRPEFIELPVPTELKTRKLSCQRQLLVFKLFPNKVEFVWLYDKEKSVLLNSCGEVAKMTNVRRFMALLYKAYDNA